MPKKPVLANSGNMERNTPKELVEMARRVLGRIDLDPASNDVAQETVRAGAYFTKDDNGLNRPWCGRVFLNPPYASAPFRAFVRHLIQEYLAGRVTAAVVVTNNNTETSATQALLQVASAWCFPRSRVRFTAEDLSGAAGGLQGQLITYFGDSPALFLAVFSAKGATGVPVRVPSVDLFNNDAARAAFEGRE